MRAIDMSPPILATIDESAPLIDAARVMREKGVGDILIARMSSRGARPVGLITDRDIVVHAIACDLQPDELTVADLCTRKRRGKVKMHEEAAHGRVTVLEPAEDYGRLETADGRDIYFHRNSLGDADFDDLAIGTELRFVEEAGEKGPQASSVFVIGKHHPVP